MVSVRIRLKNAQNVGGVYKVTFDGEEKQTPYIHVQFYSISLEEALTRINLGEIDEIDIKQKP